MVSIVALAAPPANAEETRPRALRIPLALELTSFRPASTSVIGGGLDQRSVFGPDRRVLFRLRSGVGLSTVAGSFDLTVSIGAWRASGSFLDLAGGLEPRLSDVSLWLVPMALHAQWNADALHRLYSFPLFPFVRAGLSLVRWTFGRVAASQTIGNGWATGPEFSGGLEVILDGVDPRLAREAEREFHIRSSRVMCQWTQVFWTTATAQDFSGGGFGCGLVLIL